MKKVLSVFLVLICSAVCFADVKIVQKHESGPMMGQPAKNFTQTIYIKGNKARIDMTTGTVYQIIDLESKKLLNVDPSKKQVTSMSLEMMKAAGGMFGAMGKETKTDVKKTGSSKTVNGFKCDEYLITMQGPISMTSTQCIAQDADVPEFEPMKEYFMEFARMTNINAKDFPKGLPVQSTMKMSMMGQNMSGFSEVQSISRDPLADSLFTVPSDYKVQEMKMPQ